MIFIHEMGLIVKDTLTPFEGAIIARSEYLDGEKKYLVQPNGCTDNGAPIDAYWFTEVRLIIEKPKGTS